MNYYARHIGDYLKATTHLSLLEHGIYSRLLDVYYTREAPIPKDQAARLIGARSKIELEALNAVLAEFFDDTPEGWRQSRCDKEIGGYQEKSSKASASAKARWDKSQGNANAMRTHTEGNAPNNQEPITNNQVSTKAPPAARTPASKKSQMPPDFGISDRVKAWAIENKHGQLEQHLVAFRLACQAKGYAYADWDAAFMKAVRDNWAKLAPTPQQLAAAPRKPDKYDRADLEYEKRYGTPESIKALTAKLTGVAA